MQPITKPLKLFSLKQALNCARSRRKPNLYNVYNIIPSDDSDFINTCEKLNNLYKEGIDVDYPSYFQWKSPRESRGIACLLGLGITDALGACTQFLPFQKSRHHLILKGFPQIPPKIRSHLLNFRGQVGVWTDDCSMALCLADSLLSCDFQLNPIDLRYRFMLWLDYGLNNGGRPSSIGLGGNISIAMMEFERKQEEYCEKGDGFNNGNGSLMRLGPVGIAVREEGRGMDLAARQSRTTHNGEEAMECCRLLALILIRLINRGQSQDPKQVLLSACDSFQTLPTSSPLTKSVQHLAKSQTQPQSLFLSHLSSNPKFSRFNKSHTRDRNWQWKDPNWSYSKTRLKQQSGYIGSYCMDGLCMALHVSYHTSGFQEAALWTVNMGGDCDTVGAIVGQITGAMYGVDKQMMRLYGEMPDAQSQRYHLWMKAVKLVSGRAVKQGRVDLTLPVRVDKKVGERAEEREDKVTSSEGYSGSSNYSDNSELSASSQQQSKKQ